MVDMPILRAATINSNSIYRFKLVDMDNTVFRFVIMGRLHLMGLRIGGSVILGPDILIFMMWISRVLLVRFASLLLLLVLEKIGA